MRRAALALLVLVGCAPAPASTLSPVIGSAPRPAAAEPEPPPPAPDLGLYRASYGEGAPTLVYLHGGPGHNSSVFEATAAEALAQRQRVIVYDRRGTGRSEPADDSQAFTFARAVQDLDAVLADVEEPVLLGHSFGGALALAYLEAHPEFEGRVILVNAPIVFQRTLSTIIENCRAVHADDAEKLRVFDQLEALDHESTQYMTLSFMHGIQCGLYSPRQPTREAQAIAAGLATHPAAKWLSDSQPMPVFGFLENEHYNTLDLSRRVELQSARISAIYSDEDRIISPEDRAFLRETLGERYVEIQGAAHNVFLDQQAAFIQAVDQLTR